MHFICNCIGNDNNYLVLKAGPENWKPCKKKYWLMDPGFFLKRV
jgi:hypothetical protein